MDGLTEKVISKIPSWARLFLATWLFAACQTVPATDVKATEVMQGIQATATYFATPENIERKRAETPKSLQEAAGVMIVNYADGKALSGSTTLIGKNVAGGRSLWLSDTHVVEEGLINSIDFFQPQKANDRRVLADGEITIFPVPGEDLVFIVADVRQLLPEPFPASNLATNLTPLDIDQKQAQALSFPLQTTSTADNLLFYPILGRIETKMPILYPDLAADEVVMHQNSAPGMSGALVVTEINGQLIGVGNIVAIPKQNKDYAIIKMFGPDFGETLEKAQNKLNAPK